MYGTSAQFTIAPIDCLHVPYTTILHNHSAINVPYTTTLHNHSAINNRGCTIRCWGGGRKKNATISLRGGGRTFFITRTDRHTQISKLVLSNIKTHFFLV